MVQGQIKVAIRHCTSTPPTKVPSKCHLLHLTDSEIDPRQDSPTQGHTKDVAHIPHPLPQINVPIKFQLSAPYGF